jgi:UDP-N-acetylglucosamine diphosphorylase / glucose-1-phosphate thymidylyltransferase / UDP-N-acetylgalactosamine diphosphorylase / glucosamine-1-phosphate N-acetyltransferase / galactosamine-1-phosphate N-acetyltransferase
MKALVLAAGRGSRLGEHSQEHSKCMLRFLGKPLLQYSLESAVRARVEEIVLVVGYRAEEIINEFGNHFQGVRIRYVIQRERRGTVHAFECSQEALAGADFMLFLADEILFEPCHTAMVQCFEERNLFVVCGVVKEPNRAEIRKTYAIIHNDLDRRIYRIIEKPRRPPNNLRGTGNCIFRNEIFDYLELTPINPHRNEKELPDLIQCAIDDGHTVTSFDVGAAYININTPEDIEIAERASLSHALRQVDAEDLAQS